MKTTLPTAALRLLLLTLLATAALFTTACRKDDPDIQDYSGIDDDLIKKYLTDHNITTAQKQASGLYFLPVTTNPAAARVAIGTTVSVLYTGHLLDATGTVFDASSQHNNTPVIFTLGNSQIIPGFQEGISLMHIGDRAELLIPSALAYGPSGAGSTIPPNAVLRFEVEVVDYATVDDNLITSYLSSHNITTAQKQLSGLYFLPVTTNPTAVRPTTGSRVSVLYTGHLLDATGTVFDASSLHNNTPFSFTLGSNQVIAGFDQGIALMHKGDRAELIVPSALAYGPRGSGSTIAPNTVLRFEVELVDVQ